MKINRSKIIAAFLLIVALVALALPPAAQAQVTPGATGTFGNLVSPFTSTNTISATTNTLTLQEHSGIALQLRQSGAATSLPSGLWIWFSVDGTNYPATPNIIWTNAVSVTHTTFVTNLTALQLVGYQSMKVQLTNGTGLALTNNVMWHRWNRP